MSLLEGGWGVRSPDRQQNPQGWGYRNEARGSTPPSTGSGQASTPFDPSASLRAGPSTLRLAQGRRSSGQAFDKLRLRTGFGPLRPFDVAQGRRSSGQASTGSGQAFDKLRLRTGFAHQSPGRAKTENRLETTGFV